MDLPSSELENADPSSPFTSASECLEPDTESDFSSPLNGNYTLQRSDKLMSPASSTLFLPDSDQSAPEDDLEAIGLTDPGEDEDDLGCRPLEEFDKDSDEATTQGGASGNNSLENEGKIYRYFDA